MDSTNLAGPSDRLERRGISLVPFSPIEPLTVTPSVRYDYYSDFPGYLSFRLGPSWRCPRKPPFGVLRRARTVCRHSASCTGRIRYGDGNPNLKPETSYCGEIGWTLKSVAFSGTAVFTRLVFDQIDWVTTASRALRAVNIGESFLPGSEVHGRCCLTDHSPSMRRLHLHLQPAPAVSGPQLPARRQPAGALGAGAQPVSRRHVRRRSAQGNDGRAVRG